MAREFRNGAAHALAEADIRPFRADASIAYHNIIAGLEAITPLHTRIQTELPTVNVTTLPQLLDLALGVIYAIAHVDRLSDATTPALLEKARVSRRLVKSAEALVAHSWTQRSFRIEWDTWIVAQRIKTRPDDFHACSARVGYAHRKVSHDEGLAGSGPYARDQSNGVCICTFNRNAESKR